MTIFLVETKKLKLNIEILAIPIPTRNSSLLPQLSSMSLKFLQGYRIQQQHRYIE